MQVFVDYSDARWKKYKIDYEKIADVVACEIGVDTDAEMSIILTDDETIHALNKQYRNIDRPTNVLSFELGDDMLLGDVYISLDTVLREAATQNKILEHHVTHLVVHGALHLNGYDHIDDADADVMEACEINILKKLGIKNPYSDDMSQCDSLDCCPGGRTLRFLRRFVPRENGFWQYVVLFLLGVIASFGFAPFNMWYLTLIGLGAAYAMLSRNPSGGIVRRFLRAFPFGAGYGVAMFWWTLSSIYVVPELAAQFAIWTVPGLIGLALGGGAIFSIPFAVSVKNPRNNAHSAILFAASWTLVLWLREWAFTGFPWNPIANIMMPYPIVANSMSLFGALGLTFVLVGIVALMVENLRDKKCCGCRWALGCVVLIGVCGALYGYKNIIQSQDMPNEKPQIIRVVQPARAQNQKMAYSRDDALRNAEENVRQLFDLARAPGDVDLIVFPETSYPFVVVPGDNMGLAKILGRDIIIGANVFENGRRFNSMIMADKNGVIQNVYHKAHLVPFGEYSPLGIMPAPISLARGDGATVVDFSGCKFAPAVCYEIIFSDSLVPYGARADMIVNITNDTWFGVTPGVYQHLDMVRRYAIESGVPVVRANYSGISAFISADGAIISMLPVGVSGILDGYVWGAHDTPYRIIGRNGMMIIILLFSVMMICGTAMFCRKK